jgi:NitT/TauT family transport system permease protein
MTAYQNEEAMTRRRRRRLPGTLDGLAVGIVILAAWEIGVRLGGVPAYLLPAPSAIAIRLFNDWQAIAFHTAVTTSEILIGFLLSIVISIPLAAVLAQFRSVERALYPVLVASQTVPKVAIAPLLVVWFGFGLAPKVIIAFLVCFFPIVIDSMIGFRSAPKEVLWLARSMGTSRWKTFAHFQIPAALPNIFAGVKVASTLAVVGAVVGEFVASDRGLGYQLIVANGTLDVGLSFAVLVTLSVLGIVLFGIIDLLERMALPWHVSQRVTLPPASRSS